jgi:S1/P1 Nuclease
VSSRTLAALALIAAIDVLSLCGSGTAHAWGDEGHEIIGRIAEQYLDPTVLAKVRAILANDNTHLTADTTIEQEATWADRFRDQDREGSRRHYNETWQWHFVDLELSGPDLRYACFGEPPLKGRLASQGPAADCIVDKINEFLAELGNPATSDSERVLALQFVLHLVGDVHQPLHASDYNDRGGNSRTVTVPDMGIAPNNLHHYWDTEFVTLLGPDESTVAQQLTSRITPAQRARWSAGTAADWATESFDIARLHAYGLLPPPLTDRHYNLPASYVTDATAVVAEQLSKAGVRLAFVLNETLL